MTFRPLVENDLESLLELYVHLGDSNRELSREKAMSVWHKVEEQGNITYFGAVDGDRVVATCYLAVIPNLTHNGRSIGFIENVVTHEDYRMRGIGKKLIEQAVEHCRRSDCYKVLLQSGNSRTGAHEFYEKLGFNGNSKKAFEIRL